MSENEPAQMIEGRYRIVRNIAEGGMATVYEAIDERLGRTVAIKVMHTQLAKGPHREQFVERFRREANSAASIANPHIVQVYDTGEFNGLDFLVMEYVHGVNLRHEMNAQGTFSVRETLRVVAETLDGLASAHRAGVVHRDIKPENILINDRGHVQITDFGLAKAASQATLSSTGMLLGTAAYLAPEMIENNQATAQGDLYSVGIMAWEMLTGSVPFISDNPVTLVFKHVHEDVPSVALQCPDIDPAVARFIGHLTQRSVQARPADAGAALLELKQLCTSLEPNAWMYRKPSSTTDTAQTGTTPVPAPPAPPVQARSEESMPDATTSPMRPNATTPISEGSTQVLNAPDRSDGTATATTAMPANGNGASKETPAASSKRGRKALIIAIISLVVAVACAGGAWWYFPLCHDGAPATFTRYDFSGGTITERRSVNFSDENEQYYRVYNSGQKNVEGKSVVRINVWDWHSTWKIACRENGVTVPASQRKAVREYDDYYVTVHDACGNDISSFSFLDKYRTDHMLEYTPVTPSAEIRITATDEYGRQLFTVTTKAEN